MTDGAASAKAAAVDDVRRKFRRVCEGVEAGEFIGDEST
jgi:hypothetical protein